MPHFLTLVILGLICVGIINPIALKIPLFIHIFDWIKKIWFWFNPLPTCLLCKSPLDQDRNHCGSCGVTFFKEDILRPSYYRCTECHQIMSEKEVGSFPSYCCYCKAKSFEITTPEEIILIEPITQTLLCHTCQMVFKADAAQYIPQYCCRCSSDDIAEYTIG